MFPQPMGRILSFGITLRAVLVLAALAPVAVTAQALPVLPPGQTNTELPLAASPTARQLDGQVQDAKQAALDLEADLRQFTEDQAVPQDACLGVFLSLGRTGDFQPLSLELILDDQSLVRVQYSADQVAALRRGGVQRVYLARLAPGAHRLQATVQGVHAQQGVVRQVVPWSFEKTDVARYVELHVQEQRGKPLPQFQVRVWQ
jgi:hypothetical protein